MHPIEHLRYVARATGADAPALVDEAAQALGSLRFDPSGLVVACRRIVERHPFAGPLWWLTAGICSSVEPFDAVWELAGESRSDRSASHLAHELPDAARVVTIGAPAVVAAGLVRRGDIEVLAFDAHHDAARFVRHLERAEVDVDPIEAGVAGAVVASADVVLVEALALDASRVVVPIGSSTIAGLAGAHDVECWLVAGIGTRLPVGFVDAMVAVHLDLCAESDPWDLPVEILATDLFTSVIGPHGRLPMAPQATAPECNFTPELLPR